MMILVLQSTLLLGIMSSSEAFCSISNRYPHSTQQSHGMELRTESIITSFRSERTIATQLSMGIRSFIRKTVLNRDDEEGDDESMEDRSMSATDNPSDVKAALQAIKKDLEAVEELESQKQINLGSTTDDIEQSPSSETGTQNKIRPPPMFREAAMGITDTYGETVNERIQRVKSGSMTEEEKAQFLNTALSRRTLGSLQPNDDKKGPPIRQAIPNADGVSNMGLTSSTKSSSSSQPSPKDSLWNTVMGKRTTSSTTASNEYSARTRESLLSGNLKDDSAKREYLEMVMNPNRFKKYAVSGYQYETDEDDGNKSANDNEDVEDEPLEDEGVTSSELPMDDMIEYDESIITNNDSTTKQPPTTLASRLEQAATLQEKRDAELKLKRDAERKAQEEERMKQMEEMRKVQEERIAAKRREQELLRQKELEIEEEKERERRAKKEAERRRMEEVMAKQEEYWKKKLANEKSRKSKMMSASNGESPVETKEARMKALQQLEVQKLTEKNKLREEEERVRVEADSKETDSTKTKEVTRKEDIMEEVKVESASQPPPSSFVKEQARKKAALDELMKSQKDRLAALNSPLPKIGDNQPAVIPKRTPSISSKPPTVKKVDTSRAASTPPPAPRLSLNDLTMKKSAESSSDTSTTSSKTSPTKSSSAEPRLSLAEMTMLKRGQPTKASASSTSKASQDTKKSKGPIRQRVLLDEEEDDDDFFEYSRSGSNKNLSIKDIMAQRQKNNSDSESGTKAPKKIDAKEKSRMWGIDIDKFN